MSVLSGNITFKVLASLFNFYFCGHLNLKYIKEWKKFGLEDYRHFSKLERILYNPIAGYTVYWVGIIAIANLWAKG